MIKAHARNSDPQTSHDAADSIQDLTGVQTRIMQLFDKYHAMSDEELIVAYGRQFASFFPSSESSIRSRRSDLAHKGYLVDSGRKSITKAGRPTIIWQSADKLFGEEFELKK